MKAVIKALKNYAVFAGRTSREEFWTFVMFYILGNIAVDFIGSRLGALTGTDQSILDYIYTLALLIPTAAIAVRRMHDTSRPGWWCLVPIAGLIFAVEVGDFDGNRYGLNPNAKQRSF
jgi:uncharacterized membrane protein YhaH (DUF805 family)